MYITELANIISELPISDRRAVGCEKKTLETLTKMSPSPLSEYRKMQSDANKVIIYVILCYFGFIYVLKIYF